eukprot:CAMPEP_0119551454 /NCGR_PEP_ID=MMETSP1352-20130426/4711_1 /TAXON_ID=265584 /ORGANISM="Stauroneis constricta, Strain CCMP1120" /LENGTH=121 /DNA_ID=CAMNT_0007597521 /DNA_START=3 /DNA_END=364 /DNA_ORIENTATION=+
MTQIILAYDQLMDNDNQFFTRDTSSKTAIACEIYTIDELRQHHYDVYSIQIVFDRERKDSTSTSTTEISCDTIIPIQTHPNDSVFDLKRIVQERMGDEWNLFQRRQDRDGIAFGWELVFLR